MPIPPILSAREFDEQARRGGDALTGTDGLLAVALDEHASGLALARQPACVVAGVGRAADDEARIPDWVDVCVEDDAALATLAAAVAASPEAAAVAVRLIRHNATSSVANGLFAESLAYSTLQHGATFERWLRGREPAAPPASTDPQVIVARRAETLGLTLNRPARRNAYCGAMRDELHAALELVLLDGSIERVELRGDGAAFCSGGDLDEFGVARDAAAAHALRMTRSVAHVMHELRDRVYPLLHGACIGAGIELTAFASHLRAREDAFFQLPEVGFGLVPGAGGTVSVTRRIGRLRTNWLALTGERIDAATALRWGLVDEIRKG
ncbi:MAG: enoyl-CoA hydratase/isomerase family protein [Pseudomonadota bacterium]